MRHGRLSIQAREIRAWMRCPAHTGRLCGSGGSVGACAASKLRPNQPLANRPAGEQKCQLASPIQGLDEIVPIRTIQKNIFAPVSPAQDMIHGAGIFNTSVAGHEYNPMALSHRRQPENEPYYGLISIKGG